MTAYVHLHCDRPLDAHSMCASTAIVDGAATIGDARAAAARYGWSTSRDGADRCPRCSGRGHDLGPYIIRATAVAGVPP